MNTAKYELSLAMFAEAEYSGRWMLRNQAIESLFSGKEHAFAVAEYLKNTGSGFYNDVKVFLGIYDDSYNGDENGDMILTEVFGSKYVGSMYGDYEQDDQEHQENIDNDPNPAGVREQERALAWIVMEKAIQAGEFTTFTEYAELLVTDDNRGEIRKLVPEITDSGLWWVNPRLERLGI